MTALNPLKREFDYYVANQEELLKEHSGKVLVIFDEEVIGVYENESEAVEKTAETKELGTFLVQRCTPGTEGYTQTFHSRIVLS